MGIGLDGHRGRQVCMPHCLYAPLPMHTYVCINSYCQTHSRVGEDVKGMNLHGITCVPAIFRVHVHKQVYSRNCVI